MSNARLVLVDSSVWIGYLTVRSSTGTKVVTDLLATQILTGAKSESQYSDLSDQWEGLRSLPMVSGVWRRAERLRFDLRRKGWLVPLPDVLIASSAIAYDCELLHADRHYEQIARITPLKIFR
jgi:predicted nucleic acid-binding protein